MILAEHEAKGLLEKAQIPVIGVKVVGSVEEAKVEAQVMGYPVVLKLSTPLHSHKTDVGGVILNIRDSAELERAFSGLNRLRGQLDPDAAIIIEPMAALGAEFFIGVQRHETFGLVMSLGLGGIWLELLKDVSFRLLPATRGDLWEMLCELKSWPGLREGFRHLPAVNPGPLLALLESIAALALGKPQLREMDLNPVMVYPDHAVVVDARMVVDHN